MENKCNCPCHQEEVKEDTKKECGNHDWTYIPGNGQLCKNCGKVLRQGHVEPPEGPIRVDDTYSDDDLKEPARKPSQRIREIEDQLKRDQPNDMEDVMEYAVYCANMRSRAIIQYLNETQ